MTSHSTHTFCVHQLHGTAVCFNTIPASFMTCCFHDRPQEAGLPGPDESVLHACMGRCAAASSADRSDDGTPPRCNIHWPAATQSSTHNQCRAVHASTGIDPIISLPIMQSCCSTPNLLPATVSNCRQTQPLSQLHFHLQCRSDCLTTRYCYCLCCCHCSGSIRYFLTACSACSLLSVRTALASCL